MATAQNLIDAALQKLGAIPSGGAGGATESTEILAELNRMLTTFNNDRALIHATTIEQLTLTADQESYTIGSGGDLATTRPQEVTAANLMNTAGDEIWVYLNLRTADWWANDRPSKAVSSIPRDFYYNPTYGTNARGTIYLSPTPDAAYILELHSWGLLSSIAAVGTTIALPPGYEDLLIWHLAERIWPMYPNPQVLPMIQKQSERTMNAIKRKNQDIPVMKTDFNGTTTEAGRWDVRTGGHF